VVAIVTKHSTESGEKPGWMIEKVISARKLNNRKAKVCEVERCTILP
jgi:hypothetical protein